MSEEKKREKKNRRSMQKMYGTNKSHKRASTCLDVEII